MRIFYDLINYRKLMGKNMIKKNKIIILLLFSIILLSAISTVSASDVAAVDDLATTDAVEDTISLDAVDDAASSDSNDLELSEDMTDDSSNDEDEIYDMDIDDNVLGQASNQDELSANSKSLRQLEGLINETPSGTTLYLEDNFTYVSGDPFLKIDKPMTIYGNGNVIDCRNQTRGFEIRSAGVTFVNLTFVNCGPSSRNYDGGAILSNANYNTTVINCTFSYCNGYNGGAINKVNAINCKFYNCRAKYYGGAIYSGNYTMCSFSGNSAGSSGSNTYSSTSISPKIYLLDQTGTYVYVEQEYPFDELEVTTKLVAGNWVLDGYDIYYYYGKSNYDIGSGHVLSGSSVTFTFDSAGSYYSGFNLYNYSSSAYSYLDVKINGFKTYILASNMTIDAGADEYLVANLTYGDNVPMIGFNVSVMIGYDEYDNLTTDGNGQIKIPLKNLRPSQYPHYIELSFLGDAWYENTYASYSVNVKGTATKIIVPTRSVTKVYGEEYFVTATLLDENDQPLVGYNLTCLGENYTTDELGQVNVSLKYAPYGYGNVQIYFNGDMTYMESSNYTQTSVSKANVTFSAPRLIINHYDSANYTTVLVDQFGNILKNTLVYYYTSYNTTRVNVTTNETGEISFEVPNTLNLGDYTVYLGFSGSNNYNSRTSYGYITVKKITPQINASDIRVIYDSTGELLVTFLNETGEPLEGFELFVTLNGVTTSKTTGPNGQFIFEIPKLDVGLYPININFNEMAAYGAVSKTVNLEVSKMKTFIEASDIDLIYNQTATIVARFFDEEGNNLIGYDLNVNLNGVDTLKTTDSNGQISIDIPVLDGGTHPLTISFAGEGIYDESSKVVNVNVERLEAIVSAEDFATDYNSGEYFVVTFKDTEGNAIEGRNISIKTAGQIFTEVTDINGEAKFLLKLAPKTYAVNVTFDGDGVYKENSTKVNITIKKIINDTESGNSTPVSTKIPTKLTAPKLTTPYLGGKYLVATLKDKNGKAIKGAKITIKINGKTYNRTTNSDGQAKLIIKLAPRNYTATITFAGDSKYEKSSTTAKVVVTKVNPKIVASNKSFSVKTKTKSYTVTLKNHQNKVLKNSYLTLKVNGKTYKVKTNTKGKATFKISNLTKKGTYSAVITYKGNSCYKKITKTVKITAK